MASERDAREALVVRRLRALIGFVAALGLLVIALGQLEVEVTDIEYQVHSESAGGRALPLLVLVLLAPGGWAFQRPRWPQLVVWIMWFASWSVVGFTLAVGNRVPAELVDPPWVRPLILLVLAAIAACVIVALPLVRRTHESPPIARDPALPSARAVARSKRR